MSVLDYTNQNSLTRYPFKDNASLQWTGSSTGELPNSIVTDAQFTAFGGYAISPGLLRITTDTHSWTFVFTVSKANTQNTLTFKLEGSGLIVAAAKSTDAKIVGRIEVNTAALNELYAAGTISNDLTFDPTDCAVCASTIRYSAPVVSQVAFSNYPNEPKLVVDTDNGATLFEGTNLQLSGTDKLIMDVIAGAGQGLYDACQPLQGLFYRINNITANSYGNFSVTGDQCFSFDPSQQGLTVAESCKPKCTEAELQAFAHYLNRVRSGLLGLADYIKEVKGNYDKLVMTYKDWLQRSNGIKSPYMLVEAATASNRVNDYHNIACAVYSPSKEVLPGTLTMTMDPMFSVMPGSVYVTQDGIKKGQAELGFTERMMKCNDVIYHNCVISNSRVNGASPINNGDQKFDVAFSLASTNSYAYFSIPLLATTPNYTISYTVLNTDGVRKIKLLVDLLHKENIGLNCSLVMRFPEDFIMTSGNLIMNQVLKTPLTSSFGFTNVALDFSKKLTCAMEFTCTNPTVTTEAATFNLMTPLGIAKKTINFKL